MVYEVKLKALDNLAARAAEHSTQNFPRQLASKGRTLPYSSHTHIYKNLDCAQKERAKPFLGVLATNASQGHFI